MGLVRSITGAPALAVVAIGEAGWYYDLGLAVLGGMMIWGAVLAYHSWEEATEDLDPATRDELLDVFEQARAEGELDETEFARVRRRIEDGE